MMLCDIMIDVDMKDEIKYYKIIWRARLGESTNGSSLSLLQNDCWFVDEDMVIPLQLKNQLRTRSDSTNQSVKDD